MSNISSKAWFALGLGGGAALLIGVAIFFVILTTPVPANYFPEAGIYVPGVEESIVPRNSQGSLDVTISGERLELMSFTDLDVGAYGVGTSFEISASTGSIIVEVMTADGLTCPTFTFVDSEIFDATYINNIADGNNFLYTGGSPADITISSLRGAKSRIATADSFDKIKITATSDVRIKALVISDVRVYGGGCTFSDMKIGTLYVTNSVVGTGDGIDVKEFGFGSNVTIGTITTTNNLEVRKDVR